MKTFWLARDKEEGTTFPYTICTKKMNMDRHKNYSPSIYWSDVFTLSWFEKVFGLKLKPGQQVQVNLSIVKPRRKTK